MTKTKNLRILETTLLQTPNELLARFPVGEAAASRITGFRRQIELIALGEDPRLLAIVGPCSIHDPKAAIDYAHRLAELRDRYADALMVVMRVYFEKPRTTLGWKGLINDPHLKGVPDIPEGLRVARRLLLEIADLGLPAATEFLDPIIPQYLADLVSWAAIGARTTESQTHREMASGLSMPVGFKNGTDGSLMVALNAMIAAAQPHSFLGIDEHGRVGVVRTAGNPHGHLVLRGGSNGPNCGEEAVREAARELHAAGVNPRVLIDASHGNSGKDYRRQPEVLAEVAGQLAAGSPSILGVMIESNLVGGQQTLGALPLVYGQSITDGCVDLATTERMLEQLVSTAPLRRRKTA
jgi:3-deoxy-7-phosphoheptulonate synthase